MSAMQGVEYKEVKGEHTYSHAIELQDENWRLPTVFELRGIYAATGGDGYSSYWSSSPVDEIYDTSQLAWCVDSNGVDLYCEFGHTSEGQCLWMVRRWASFDHMTPVSMCDVDAFEANGKLPSWHPRVGNIAFVCDNATNTTRH